MHLSSFAINGGVRAITFDDEPKRRWRVPMRRCNFAREKQLQAGV
jgi:hypothetical protein